MDTCENGFFWHFKFSLTSWQDTREYTCILAIFSHLSPNTPLLISLVTRYTRAPQIKIRADKPGMGLDQMGAYRICSFLQWEDRVYVSLAHTSHIPCIIGVHISLALYHWCTLLIQPTLIVYTSHLLCIIGVHSHGVITNCLLLQLPCKQPYFYNSRQIGYCAILGVMEQALSFVLNYYLILWI